MSSQNDLKLCQEKLGYHFHKVKYLTIALTHSSYANEGKKGSPATSGRNFWGTRFCRLSCLTICSGIIPICQKEN